MLKRLSAGVGWRRVVGFTPVRLLFALLLLLVAYQSARIAVADLSSQALRARMEQLHKPGSGDIPAILDATRALRDYPFPGAFSADRADAYSLIRYSQIRSGQEAESLADIPAALSEFQLALNVRPRDGYLWARYGLYLSSLDPADYRGDALVAMDQAMALSPRDYNTMRVVADMGVRYWHELDCNRRANLLVVLDRAAAVDDRLLNQWITQLGQPPMVQYLNNLYAHYGFNPRWARATVAACREGSDG